MSENWPPELRKELEDKRAELQQRLERISASVRRSLDSDSEERAKQLDNSEVVDALGNESREELRKISIALNKMDEGLYGLCEQCGQPIAEKRLAVYPYAMACIDCAELEEDFRSRQL